LIGTKLKEIREKTGMNKKEFAHFIGIKYTTYNNYETEAREPASDFLTLISKKFDVSIDYLLGLKEDSSILHSYQLKSFEYEHIKKYRTLDILGQKHVDTVLQWEVLRMEQLKQAASSPAAKPPLRLIQYYQRLASAGTGQYVFDSIPTEQIEIPDIPEYRKVQFALGVNGLSMEPLYSHGDILLIEPTQEIQPGEIGIFLHNGESFVKELGDGVLHSLNDLYDDIEITEDTRCVGRVIDKLDAPISVSEELGEKLRALAKKAAEKHA